jgi:hypothetical protein
LGKERVSVRSSTETRDSLDGKGEKMKAIFALQKEIEFTLVPMDDRHWSLGVHHKKIGYLGQVVLTR